MINFDLESFTLANLKMKIMNIQEFGIFITDRNVVKLRSTTIRYRFQLDNISSIRTTEIFQIYFSQFKEIQNI